MKSVTAKFKLIRPSVYLALVAIVGADLRFWDIAKSSIWHDEGYSLMLAPMSPLEIIARTGRDVHPPLYYLVLHFWMAIFGNSEVSVRGLSAAFLIAAIPVAYFLVRRLWTEPAARIAALFVAVGPFLIRYSQEARMYGMVAFLLLFATYAFVRALQDGGLKWWSVYAVSMAGAMYTHYYTIFMFIVHGLYLLVQTRRSPSSGLLDRKWWLAVGGSIVLFLPWLPTAYHQFTRVQAAFWIPKPNIGTIPGTVYQFLYYGPTGTASHIQKVIMGVLFAAFIGSVVAAWARSRKRRLSLWLLVCYSFAGPLLVFLLSFKRPIYVDRYFVFAAVGFYCLLAVLTASLPKYWLRWPVVVVLIVLFGVGVKNVHSASNHQMRIIGNYVNANYQPGDEILSGELYTFFDFSYYNHTGAQTHLWSTQGVNGYGESSLIYDRANQIVVEKLNTIHPASGYLWMVGKTGYHEYFDRSFLPQNWTPVGPRVLSGYSSVQEYRITD